MEAVKTKKELIKAIDAGEKNICISSKKLFLACELAEKYSNAKEVLSEYVSSLKKSLFQPPVYCLISDGTIVAITLTIAVTAISIIAILKDRKLTIKVKRSHNEGITGEIVIE